MGGIAMNHESLAELVSYAQAGDINALEPLLIWAYTPVSFLCQKLLQDSHIAQTQTREILQAIAHKLPSLQSPAMFEKWVIRLTAARCIQIQNQNSWMDDDEIKEEELPIIGESLDEMQTVEAVQKMVDMLPLKPRTCMVLLCCCEMNSSGISQMTKYSVDEVRQNMSVAQTFVLEQLQKYQDLGTEFYPISSLTDVLQSGMRYEREEDAIPVVYGILGKEVPTPPDPNRGKKILLLAGIITLIFINLVLGGLNLLVKSKNTISPEDYKPVEVTVATVATEPEETVETTEAEAKEETEEAQETEAT
jgi:DNA-directed RNA polymerase specialized sigma24 family protein